MLQLVHNCLVRISVYSASFERENNFQMQFDCELNECERDVKQAYTQTKKLKMYY